MHAKTKRNFEIFSAEEFIAAITQHIPDKGFQMVRYYGWYSNRARGERAKHETEPGAPEATDVDVIDVSEYHPPRIPAKKWRELIKCLHPDCEAHRGRSGRSIRSSAAIAALK